MAIQDLPPFYDMVYTEKDGRMTRDSYLYNDQTFQALNLAIILLNKICSTIVNQGTITINGINPPSFTTSEINEIVAETDPEKQVPLGTIWYNTTDNTLQYLALVGTTRTVKTIQAI